MGNVSKREPAHGTAIAAPEKNGFSLISNDKLIELYASLLKCQMVAKRRGEGLKGTRRYGGARLLDSAAGTVGVAIDLGPGDMVSCFPLSHEFRAGGRWKIGHQASPWGSNGVSRQPLAPAFLPEATSHGAPGAAGHRVEMHFAIGAALAGKTKNSGKVAVVFANDENQEWWLEAQQIASTHGLPMIFVDSPKPDRGHANKAKRSSSVPGGSAAEGLSFPGITVDGHDVVAVYRVASEAIARARKGRGPTLIECQSFSFNGRIGSRSNGSAKSQAKHDAVVNMENYLRGKGLFQPQLKHEIIASLKKELESTIENA
jgi:pyruvate dehydrogenase E1 component alpha subunit